MVGIGNAMVDVISAVGEEFIVDHGLVKGAMTLVGADRSAQLHAAMPSGIAASGGSAANTAAGVASFGGRAAFIGKVRDDDLGEVFVGDIRTAGVAFEVPPAQHGPATARCLVQVTPDLERTMSTYLGTAALLEPRDIDTDLVASAAITYCEGYLWDVQVAKDAIRLAMEAAQQADRTVALALSDSYCVERHRDEWLDLISDRVDVVFGNEAEVLALHSTDDLQAALDRTAEMARTVAVTRGPARLGGGARRRPCAGARPRGRPGGGRDRRRRPVRRGIPVGLEPGRAAGPLRPVGQPGCRRGHQPCGGTSGVGGTRPRRRPRSRLNLPQARPRSRLNPPQAPSAGWPRCGARVGVLSLAVTCSIQ